jgi:membrane fusion protein, multidrug efflux system
MKVRSLGITVIFGLLALAGLSACGGGAGASTAGGSTSSQPQEFTVTVLNGERATEKGFLGPDGRGHDMFTPSNLTVKAGQPVHVRFINYDEGQHTFTIPELGVNQLIKEHVDDNTPSTTDFTFTFTKAGTYRYYCAVPCDGGQGGWAMKTDASGKPDQTGYMAGLVTVE